MIDRSRQPTLVLGVTVGMSLVHHEGLPALLRDRGWRVVIVTTPSRETAQLRADGFEVVGLSMRRNPSPAHDIAGLFAWVKILSSLKPDVIMVGTPKASLLGLLAARVTGVPLRLYVLHGLRLETSSGMARYILSLIERTTAKASTHVLSVSRSLMEKAVELDLVPQEKIQVLGGGSSNGVCVSPGQLSQLHWGLADNRPVVGYVGRINHDKGFSDLLDAFDTLDSWGISYASMVVGAPEGQTGNELLERYKGRLGHHQYVGVVDDVGSQYERMSVLVLPSYREGLGMVVLEAASYGVPAVVSNATGVRDSVVNDVTGWHFPVGDRTGLARTLRDAVSNPDTLRIRGRAAKARVSDEFSRQIVQGRLVKFIEGAAL